MISLNTPLVLVICITVLFLLFGPWFLAAFSTPNRIADYDALVDAVTTAKQDLVTTRAGSTEFEARLRKARDEFSTVAERTKSLVALEARRNELRTEFAEAKQRFQSAKLVLDNQKSERDALETQLHELQADLELYSRFEEYVDYGLFVEPDCPLSTYERHVG